MLIRKTLSRHSVFLVSCAVYSGQKTQGHKEVSGHWSLPDDTPSLDIQWLDKVSDEKQGDTCWCAEESQLQKCDTASVGL